MGQAYSNWSSTNQLPDTNSQQRRSRTSTPRPGRTQLSTVRNSNSATPGPSSSSRYSPYTTTGPRLRRQASRAPSSAPSGASSSAPSETPSAAPSAAPSATINEDVLAAAAQAANQEEDVEMAEPSERTNVSENWTRARVRVRAGNQLLSRIVGRSVIESIARELERRNSEEGERSGGAGEEGFQLDVAGRVELCLSVSVFIWSMLEGLADMDGGRVPGVPVGVNERIPAPGAGAAPDSGAAADSGADAGAAPGAGAEAEANVSSDAGSGTNGVTGTTGQSLIPTEMQFRMFLLPGAIDRALENFERTYNAASATVADPAAGAVEEEEGVTTAFPPADMQTESRSGDDDNEMADENAESSWLPLPSSPSSETTAPSTMAPAVDSAADAADYAEYLEQIGLQQTNVPAEDAATTATAESVAAVRQSRADRLHRLRQLAEAMRDERREIVIPVVVLGLRLSEELQRTIFSAVQEAASGAESNDADADADAGAGAGAGRADRPLADEQRRADGPLADEQRRADGPLADEQRRADGPLADEQRRDGFQSVLRSLGRRLGGVIPGAFESLVSSRNAASNSNADIIADVPDTPDASTTPGVPNIVDAATLPPAAAGTDAAMDMQPGLSVFITIHHMQLGNPLLLPMLTYSLFPELARDDQSSASNLSNVDGGHLSNNYDLLSELSSILGQVRSHTVSQDMVDKVLKRYIYKGLTEGGVPLACPVGEEEDKTAAVELVSAERCPVCMDAYVVGDLLRVLDCRHALHTSCGDSWFTLGANKCPICRAEAVHIKKLASPSSSAAAPPVV